jgi:hypothetical protein
VSSAEATVKAVRAAESVDGGEAVGMPSLSGAVGGLAAALSQWQTVTCEVSRLAAVGTGEQGQPAEHAEHRQGGESSWYEY